MSDQPKHDEVLEFRIKRLEDAVADLSTIKDAVLRFEAKFANTDGAFNCPMHKMKVEQLEDRMNKFESDMGEMKSFTNKAIGALVVISIAIQLIGPMVLDHFKEHAPVKIEQKSK